MTVGVHTGTAWDLTAPIELTPSTDTYVARINVGGPSYIDGDGNAWSADEPGWWTGSTVHTYASVPAIDDTVDDVLYRTQRWGVDMGVTIPGIPNGDYVVALHFAEQTNGYDAAGVRVQTITGPGATWADIDVWDLVERNREVVLERAVTVTAGTGLPLIWSASAREGFVNAISVRTGTAAAADPAPMDHTPTVATNTSDPDAIPAAGAVLDLLVAYAAAPNVLIGQHLLAGRTNLSEIDDLETETGERVAVISMDLAQEWAPPMDTIAGDHVAAGGLVQVGAHSPNPVNGMGAFEDMEQPGGPTHVDMTTLLTPGSATHIAFNNHLDDVAGFFLTLQALGVVVIYRPLHEVNTSGFWWAALNNTTVTPTTHNQLWAHIWDRIVNVNGCHNVLFLWSNTKNFNSASSGRGTRQDWMPAADKVDVGGMSAYDHTSTSYSNTDLTRVSDWLDAYAAKWPGKPAVISETGGNTSSGGFDTRSLQHLVFDAEPGRIAYVLAWTGSKHRWTSAVNKALLGDTRAVWRGDLPAPGVIAGDQVGDTTFLESPKPGMLWRLSGSASPWDLRIGTYGINAAEADTPNIFQQETATTPEGSRLTLFSYHDGDLDSRYGSDTRHPFEELGIGRYTELWFRYYRLVPTGYFPWSEGKEPGLQGKIAGGSMWWPSSSHNQFPDDHDYRQFGCRTMFKGQGMIDYLNVVRYNGRLHKDNRNVDGRMYSFSTRWVRNGSQNFIVAGTWHLIEHYIKLNDVGQDNGVWSGYVDGVRCSHSAQVEYRAVSTTQGVTAAQAASILIDQVNLVQFYGGGTSTYPTSPVKIRYKDFAIGTQRIGSR